MVEKKNGKSALAPKPIRLVRLEKDRVIAGVCSGIALYFDVDTAIVRLFFVLFTIFGGSGVLLYIILWLVIPSESKLSDSTQDAIHHGIDEMKAKAHSFTGELKEKRRTRENSRYIFAFLLIVCGALFFLNNLGMFHWFTLERFWPLILVLFGFTILLRG